MIKKEVVDEILETARIEEVVGEFVQLKRAGSNMKGLSPFQDEKTPSFFVSPSKGIFKDFSSGKGGNSVSFLMEAEHMTYPEALRWLADKYQIDLEEEELDPAEQEAQSERESLYIVTRYAEEYFENILHNSEEGKAIGLSYFKERGFNKETIDTFHLGYSPDRWDAFMNSASEKGYKEDYLIKTGLIKVGKNNKSYDGFKGRVIFPIHNLSGRPIAFGARTLKKDKNIPKYLNSPESDIYKKSNVLYGIYQAKASIIKYDNCFLVEGYTDVISFYQSGIQNVVASSGTSLTDGQIRLISRYTKNITVLYDGDNAGIKASFRGIDLILKEGLNVKCVLFPDGEDPDSFAKKLGSNELKEFVTDNAKDFIVFKTDLLSGEAQGDPIKKASLIHQIVDSIALIPDMITRSLYIKECAKLMEIPEQALLDELNKSRKKVIEEDYKVQSRKQKQQNEQPQQEDHLHELPPEFFATPGELANISPGAIPNKSIKTTKDKEDEQEKDVVRLLLNYPNDLIEVTIINEENKEEIVESPFSHFVVSQILDDELSFRNPIYQQIFEIICDQLERSNEVEIKHFIHHEENTITDVVVDLLTVRYELHNWEGKNIFVKSEADKLLKAAQGSVYSFKLKVISRLIGQLQEKLKTSHEKGEDIVSTMTEIKKLDEIKRELAKSLGITLLK